MVIMSIAGIPVIGSMLGIGAVTRSRLISSICLRRACSPGNLRKVTPSFPLTESKFSGETAAPWIVGSCDWRNMLIVSRESAAEVGNASSASG